MKLYFAASLGTKMERIENQQIVETLEDDGFDVYLPQRNGGFTRGYNKEIYESDIKKLSDCDALVGILRKNSKNEGTLFEIGYAKAKGKPAIILTQSNVDNMIKQSSILEHNYRKFIRKINELREGLCIQ